MMPENRVIIAGSREFTDQTKLNKVCRWIFKTARIPVSGTTIISGTCRGTDKMGEEYAREEGMAVARFPADWSRYGKMAGPRRNGEMARYAMKKGCNGVLIAFFFRLPRQQGHSMRQKQKVSEQKVLQRQRLWKRKLMLWLNTARRQ